LIGYVGDARAWKENRPAERVKLTANEQYSYMSLWSLMASPLFFGGDMARLDEFTLNVLCNSEVIAINQDLLGKQARIIRKTDDEFILAKPLEDHSLAVGLFNLQNEARNIEVSWSDLEIQGRQEVRDLWRQKPAGTATGTYGVQVAPHGVMLVRLSGKKLRRR
jgi:alpha-galactosidase